MRDQKTLRMILIVHSIFNKELINKPEVGHPAMMATVNINQRFSGEVRVGVDLVAVSLISCCGVVFVVVVTAAD